MSTRSTTDYTDLDQEFGVEAGMARRLLALNRAPRPALAARVRAVAAAAGASRPARRAGVPRLAWAAIAVTLLLVGLVAVSPPLRAALGIITEQIGDVVLSIADRLPDSSETVVYDYTWVTLDQAPFPFGMPAYVPDGWTTDGQIGINHLRGENTSDLLVRWTRPDHAHIFMSVWQATGGETPATLIGTGSYHEVRVNGRPAVIVRGGWDSDTGEWDHPNATTLLWTAGQLQYSLWSTDPGLPESELIRMAESVP